MATFQTLKETSDQDLAIENGDLVLIQDQDVVIQQIKSNYRHSEGDWFLDLLEGLNYYDNENGIIGGSPFGGLSEENRTDLIEVGVTSVGIRELVNLTPSIDSEGVLTIPITFITIFAPEEQQTTIEI